MIGCNSFITHCLDMKLRTYFADILIIIVAKFQLKLVHNKLANFMKFIFCVFKVLQCIIVGS